jgi:hypothetical protein
MDFEFLTPVQVRDILVLYGYGLIFSPKPATLCRAKKRRFSMGKLEESFNRSGFSRFINGPAGRIFRFVAGLAFLVVGYVYRGHTLGVISMVWSIFPLSAGAFDLCYFSALLGGPISGAKIRSKYKTS